MGGDSWQHGNRDKMEQAATIGLSRFREVVGESRQVEAELVRQLAVVDVERSYLHEAVPSLFDYMTKRLGFSEGAAYKRIRVARLSRAVPQVLDALASGRMHLSGLVAMSSVLSPENADGMLEWAAGKSKKLIEAYAEALKNPSRDKRPKPTPRPKIRPIVVLPSAVGSPTVPAASLFDAPVGGQGTSEQASPIASAKESVAPKPDNAVVLYELSLTIGEGRRKKWDRASGLMGYRPGDNRVLEDALDLLITALEKERYGAPRAARSPRAAQPSQMPSQMPSQTPRQMQGGAAISPRPSRAPYTIATTGTARLRMHRAASAVAKRWSCTTSTHSAMAENITAKTPHSDVASTTHWPPSRTTVRSTCGVT